MISKEEYILSRVEAVVDKIKMSFVVEKLENKQNIK
jgi:hypothetical protein